MDFLAFRTGNLDEKGKPERFVLPTYMKDLYSYSQKPGTTLLARDMLTNADIMGVVRAGARGGKLTTNSGHQAIMFDLLAAQHTLINLRP